MKYLKGESRQQLVLFSDYLDDIVDIDNPVRFIDVFVDKLDIEKMGVIDKIVGNLEVFFSSGQNNWSNFITNVKPIVFLIKFEGLPKQK